jgi:lipoprotein-anchoring transpeptidase ErfK/SrfK
MRKSICGLIAVVLFGLTGSALFAVGAVGGHSHPVQAKAAVAAAPVAPAAPAADSTIQAATDVAAVNLAAGTTQLASPKDASIGLIYFDHPWGQVAGSVSGTTWGGPTARPIIKTQNGWVQIRLDSRPNASTGWVYRSDVNITTTNYRIVISVGQRNLTLFQNNLPVYSAPVGVGRPQWPTPLGPSFIDAVVAVPARQQRIYGPTALITATHSNVFTEFDGGDGTVAIHAYPSDPASTRGVMSSHGCVRVSPQTIDAISMVPAGTPLDIVA